MDLSVVSHTIIDIKRFLLIFPVTVSYESYQINGVTHSLGSYVYESIVNQA